MEYCVLDALLCYCLCKDGHECGMFVRCSLELVNSDSLSISSAAQAIKKGKAVVNKVLCCIVLLVD